MKKIIHVNQNQIRKNNKHKTNHPVITCKTYKSNTYTDEVIIFDAQGNKAAKIIHSPNKPLSCGARVWIETNNHVQTK